MVDKHAITIGNHEKVWCEKCEYKTTEEEELRIYADNKHDTIGERSVENIITMTMYIEFLNLLNQHHK